MRTRIWVPEAPLLNFRRYKELNFLESMVRIEGWFRIDLIHKRTGLIARHLEFRNMIVDQGMDDLNNAASSTLMNYCAVGTGTTAPVAADSALGTELVRTNSNGGFADTTGIAAANEYLYFSRTRVFTTAQANGNLSEVGMFTSSSAGRIFCRQLLKDDLGNPTTITKTSDYELRVVYEFRVYPNLNDVVYSATVNGSPMDVTSRPAAINSSSYWFASSSIPGKPAAATVALAACYSGVVALGAVTGNPTGTSNPIANTSDLVNATYVPGNFYRDTTVTWAASVANAATIKAFLPGNQCFAHQHLLTTAIAKTNTQKLVLLVRGSWSRTAP